MGFVHLQATSGYSFMRSTLSVEKLVKGARDLGFSSVALTDDNVMHGAVQFYKQCVNEGIKPLFGIKVMIQANHEEDSYLVILLAKTNKGYQNLMQLSSYVANKDFGAITLRASKEWLSDLFVILPVAQSNFTSHLLDNRRDGFLEVVNEWEKIIGLDSLYIGVQDHGFEEERKLNQIVKNLCDKQSINAVAIHDVRYLYEEDYLAYDCLQFIREGKHWPLEGDKTNSKHRHMPSANEMENKFSAWWPEVIENTEKIAERCNITFNFNKQYLPSYPTPHGLSASEYLHKLCEQSLMEKYCEDEVAKERLNYELQVIDNMGFSDYFLIVWDFIKFARSRHILVGPGRGSAAGSLVAYLLHITEVDPLAHGLLFERFLNPERISMPDIDIDFSDHRRDEVIHYVKEKYGSEHVAQIITFGTFQARSLLRELIKAMAIDQQEAQFLLKEIPNQTTSLSTALQESSELMSYVKQSKKLKLLFKIAIKLEGLPRHHSTHAAGVVISSQELKTIAPVMKGNQDISLTQFPMNDLEQLGLLKMDFLGLRNLSLIEQIVKRIHNQKNKSFSLKHIPFKDEKTFELLQAGKTTGVFQLESQGMRKVLKELKPTHFEDVVVVNALFRPGPMEFIPNYIRRKHGKEKIDFPHPDLKPILESTYGVLVYQEQIMQIANQFAGLSLGEADLLRRAISKKNKEIIEREKERFLAGCTKNGYDLAVGRKIYDWIVRFANYGFNRSHSVAYSIISYQLAYLKAHYPSYFFAALLSSVTYDKDKVRQYLREAKEAGLEILPPSINDSFAFFTVEGDQSIRIALPIIKGVGKQAVEAILAARKNKPFSSIFDFCQRVSLKIVNRPVMESLILAGAFDNTNQNRATLLSSIDAAMEQGELFGGDDNQESLFDDEFLIEATYTEVEPFPPLKQLAFEKEVLGMYISSHPLATYRSALRGNGYLPLSTIKEQFIAKNAKSVVALQQTKVIRTKRGDQMAFVTIADETDEMEGIIFPNLFREVKKWLKDELLISIQGKIEDRKDQTQFLINEISLFNPEALHASDNCKRLYIKLLKNADEREQLIFLKKISEAYPGATPVLVHSSKRNETFQLASQYNIEPNGECLKKLKNHFGQEFVVVHQKK